MISALRLGTVLVDGPSMLPTLRSGDCLLVRHGGRVRPGDLVVARPWARPELLVVKRAVEPVADGWVVEADNEAVRGQGWTGGAADVLATVVLRWWPPRTALVPALGVVAAAALLYRRSSRANAVHAS